MSTRKEIDLLVHMIFPKFLCTVFPPAMNMTSIVSAINVIYYFVFSIGSNLLCMWYSHPGFDYCSHLLLLQVRLMFLLSQRSLQYYWSIIKTTGYKAIF